MEYFLMRAVPILFITVTAYRLWRRHLIDKQINSCKVDDTSNKHYSTLVNKHSFSATVKIRLSELPNDVCSYILSLLSLRDVARLATLSRNLRNVCLMLPRLDLDWCGMFGMPVDFHHSEKCERYKTAYVRNVDQVLENYRGQNIFALRLSCCLDNNHNDDVNRWISIAAANKHLQSLCLRFSCMDFCPFWTTAGDRKKVKSISSLFTQFTSLRELHLQCCILKVDNDLRLSNLTILDLTEVVLEGTKWQGFLASSSTIKCLYLRWCSNLPNKLCIGDNFPLLSYLNISYCDKLQEIELSSRNLKTFEFGSYDDVECSFVNIPHLENAGSCMRTPAYGIFFLKLAANASSLKHVFLRHAGYLIKNLPSPEGKFLMRALSLHMSMGDANALPQLLKFFPFLRRLELELPRNSSIVKYELPYFLQNLKEVRLFGFRVEWIPIATFFLQSARVLDRLVLIVARDTSWRRWGYESQCFTEHLLEGTEGCNVYILSEKECNYILDALKGKAISTSGEVIIENLLRKHGGRRPLSNEIKFPLFR